MKLIVGLGNPGNKYKNTRHNVGFLVLDSYLSKFEWKEEKNSLLIKRDDVIFCKPMTFMNLSGEAILWIKNFYNIDESQILIIHDDIYLPEGVFRFGINRSHGGHNGIKNIILNLQSNNFLNLRIGVGPREKINIISDYVLENFSFESMSSIKSLFPIIFQSLDEFIGGKEIAFLQNKYNNRG